VLDYTFRLRSILSSRKTKNFFFSLLSFGLILLLTLPSVASAHNYSASFTTLKIEKDQTELKFSIDTTSLIELLSGLDTNKDFELNKAEIKKAHHHLEELITETLSLDKNNHEQTPSVKKMKLVKKENKNFLECTIIYPAFSPGDTISLSDGFYAGDSGTTNYVNLMSATYGAETSQAALQGDSRTWTMLLTEVQQDQQSASENQADQDHKQSDLPKENSTNTSSWFSFFKLGIFHILTGYDHLLFLFALIIGRQKIKQYIGTVTAFTIAHSITISLSVLGIVSLPSRIVESIIALSICYVAVENIFKDKVKNRWVITFLFGLIHGMGFASILKEMEIPKSNLAIALLNFNLGIEFIQLLILLLLIPILLKLQKLSTYRNYVKYGSIAIFVLGLIWLIQRLFA